MKLKDISFLLVFVFMGSIFLTDGLIKIIFLILQVISFSIYLHLSFKDMRKQKKEIKILKGIGVKNNENWK